MALAINQEPKMNAEQVALLSITFMIGVTDEEMRVQLRKRIAQKVAADAERLARTPTNPHSRNIQCTISCANCGHSNVYPLGEMDPKESTCTHRFRFAPELGRMGALICTTCPLRIDREDLDRLNIDPDKRYSREGNALADELTVMLRENRDVMAENARLRRRLESLERKAKK